MSYRTILVHCGADEAGASAVRTAATLAACFDAMLIGVGARAWAPLLDPALVAASSDTIESLHRTHETRVAEAEAVFRSACAGHALRTEWRTADGFPSQAMVALARCADLVVAAPASPDGDDRGRPDPADLVMRAGVPVLVGPPGQEDRQPHTVLVGWKNTLEARRSLSAALPLLKIAEKVVVAHICADTGAGTARAELADVTARLQRHGVNTRCTTYPRLGEYADEDLLALAHGYGADTIVAGAYGHARLRQWAFGGVTRNLLRQEDRRVLLSR